MFHPVGSQPPSVYWRRRLILFGSVALVLVLVALTVLTLTSKDDKKATAGGTSSTSPASNTHIETTSTTPSAKTSSTHPLPSKSSPSSSSAPPVRCQQQDLDVSAVVAAPTYQVGDHPMLEMQVINTSSKPCVQDLADKQIELRVYNGESRVWGSHDCEIQPGTSDRTLAVGHAVRVSVAWSGLTSQKDCAGTRQRVGAGTYTLYALLSGHTGKATQFSIS